VFHFLGVGAAFAGAIIAQRLAYDATLTSLPRCEIAA
jgi:hypothetical protein